MSIKASEISDLIKDAASREDLRKLLKAIPDIVQDNSLSQNEYTVWVNFYQVRTQTASPQKAAFEAMFMKDLMRKTR